MAEQTLKGTPSGSSAGHGAKGQSLRGATEQAAKFCDIDQLCLSGQCGFASTAEGNLLTEDQQWAKLSMVVNYANRLWR